MVNTQVALDEIRDEIIEYLRTRYMYWAVGTGTTPETKQDTQLENEVFRDAVDEVLVSVNRVLFRCYLSTADANGYNISEFGLFDSSSGGTMLFRKTFAPIGKTADIDIWFEVEEYVTVV